MSFGKFNIHGACRFKSVPTGVAVDVPGPVAAAAAVFGGDGGGYGGDMLKFFGSCRLLLVVVGIIAVFRIRCGLHNNDNENVDIDILLIDHMLNRILSPIFLRSSSKLSSYYSRRLLSTGKYVCAFCRAWCVSFSLCLPRSVEKNQTITFSHLLDLRHQPRASK